MAPAPTTQTQVLSQMASPLVPAPPMAFRSFPDPWETLSLLPAVKGGTMQGPLHTESSPSRAGTCPARPLGRTHAALSTWQIKVKGSLPRCICHRPFSAKLLRGKKITSLTLVHPLNCSCNASKPHSGIGQTGQPPTCNKMLSGVPT